MGEQLHEPEDNKEKKVAWEELHEIAKKIRQDMRENPEKYREAIDHFLEEIRGIKEEDEKGQ